MASSKKSSRKHPPYPYRKEVEAIALYYNLSLRTYRLYQCIISWANSDDGAAWPSQYRLGLQSGMHRSTVRRHLRILKDRGLIKVEKRMRYEEDGNGYRYNCYRLVPMWEKQAIRNLVYILDHMELKRDNDENVAKVHKALKLRSRDKKLKDIALKIKAKIGGVVQNEQGVVQNEEGVVQTMHHKELTPKGPQKEKTGSTHLHHHSVSDEDEGDLDFSFSETDQPEDDILAAGEITSTVSRPDTPPSLKSSFDIPDGFPPAMGENQFKEIYGYGFADAPDLLNDTEIDLSEIIAPFKEIKSNGKRLTRYATASFSDFYDEVIDLHWTGSTLPGEGFKICFKKVALCGALYPFGWQPKSEEQLEQERKELELAEREAMREITKKDREIAKREAKKIRLKATLSKVAEMINEDELGFMGAVNAGLVQDDYSTIDLSGLETFIRKARKAGDVKRGIATDKGRDQVVEALRKWC